MRPAPNPAAISCACCESTVVVAEVTTPALGTYLACDACMQQGRRPPCQRACGHPSEFLVDAVRWCTTCYEADRAAASLAAQQHAAERLRAAEADLTAQIIAIVDAALAERGL